MGKDYNSRYFKYIEHEMKPHPKYIGMRWAVFSGKNLMTVIMESQPGVTRERPKEKQPSHPFTGGGPHFHSNFEQVGILLGTTLDSPEEARVNPVYTLGKHGNELGRTGSGMMIWLPRYTVHDIKVTEAEEKAFMDEYYPHGYPKGLKYWLMDVFSPIRQDYLDYFKNQPISFDD
jgi:hypothetical protein